MYRVILTKNVPKVNGMVRTIKENGKGKGSVDKSPSHPLFFIYVLRSIEKSTSFFVI